MTDVSRDSFSIWELFLSYAQENVVDVNFNEPCFRTSAALIRSLKLTTETLPRTLEQWLELCHPDDYAQSREFLSRLFESTDETFSVERRMYCGDGEYRRFRLDAFCIRNEEGKIERLIGVEKEAPTREREKFERLFTRDLEEKLAFLKRENERLAVRFSEGDRACKTFEARAYAAERMLDAVSDPVFRLDANGRLEFRNTAFVKAAAHDPAFMTHALSVTDGGLFSCEDTWGRIRNFSACLYPLTDEYGKVKGRIGVLSDRTEFDEMEADMGRLRRLLVKNTFRDEEASFREPGEPLSEERNSSEPTKDLSAQDVLEKRFETSFKKARDALLVVAELFPDRAAQVENLFEALGAELEVGVVGITSSGKSTFINAMMGERLLPEETRATTNVVVCCRRGTERSVVVVSENGERARVSGSQLTSDWMEKLTSERLNSANQRAIAFLEWTSPNALLPEGLVLLDTPGLDACDYPEHSELILRRLLPSLDIVFYVTSIRNRFKEADIELLEKVLERDQRILFLLSKIDLEQDDVEGGKVVLSRRQKLSACLTELSESLRKVSPEGSFLRDAAIVPISSKWAMAHFYDRASSGWQASNFDPLSRYLAACRANLGRCRLESRARRALLFFSRTASDLRFALIGAAADTSVSRETTLQALQSVREAEQEIKTLMTELILPDIDRGEFTSEVFLNHFDEGNGDEVLSRNETYSDLRSFFSPILTTFREQDIQSRFMKLDALKNRKRVVLLGPRRQDSLRLLSRLAHDITFADFQGSEKKLEIEDHGWIFCGTSLLGFPHIRITAPEGLLRELEVLIAPSDAFIGDSVPKVDWKALFEKWLPIVHLDIARIDSGLSDLARAPYASALAHAKCWIAASGQGALFNDRLQDLLTDVPDRLELFARNRGHQGRVDWFIYENYDARYTDFILWGRDARSEKSGEGFWQKWTASGGDFGFPFLKTRMTLALEIADRRKGAMAYR